MIILLHGKDTYRSKRKLEEIIEEYKKKYKSGLNIIFLEEKETFKDLCDYDKQASMFGEKKLVVVRKVFSSESTKNDFFENYEKIIISENIFVLYEEGEIKENDRLLKAFLEEKGKIMIQEFQPLSGKKLFSWIKKEFESSGAKADTDAIYRLQEATGEDLWRIKNEMEKLALYKKRIKKEDVDYMVNIGVEINIFQTIDAIAEKRKKDALLLLYDHLQKGDNPLYILSMITYQFRNLISVSDLVERKYSYDAAKSKSGLHHFVFGKTYKQVKLFSSEELKRKYNSLFEMDLKAKTGQIDPVLALHLILFKD